MSPPFTAWGGGESEAGAGAAIVGVQLLRECSPEAAGALAFWSREMGGTGLQVQRVLPVAPPLNSCSFVWLSLSPSLSLLCKIEFG